MFSKINKILYAMDLSPKSIKVLGYAIDLSLRYIAYLIVIRRPRPEYTTKQVS